MAKKEMTKTTKEAVEVLTIDQLQTNLVAARNDLTSAKRGHKMGELTNPRVLSATRKKIARLSTAIRAAEIDAAKEKK